MKEIITFEPDSSAFSYEISCASAALISGDEMEKNKDCSKKYLFNQVGYSVMCAICLTSAGIRSANFYPSHEH
jgi:hypothetical protein